MSENTGGPAFPQPGILSADGIVSSQDYCEGGMTLRDYFAAKAMQAIMANDALLRAAMANYEGASEAIVAQWSYDQADAMLEEREA